MASPFLLAGCRETQDSLAPKSHQARDIASLFWWMMGGAWLGLASSSGSCSGRGSGATAAASATTRKGRSRASGEGWYVVVGLGIAMPVARDRGALRRLRPVRDQDDAGAGGDGDAADGRGHRPPVVVGDPLPRDERGDRERAAHPGAHARASRGAHRGRDPQLLGAAAEPEGRRDTGPDERGRARRRHGRAATAGRAPSSAGFSTRTWRSTSSRNPKRSSGGGSRDESRPATQPARRTRRRGRATSSRDGTCSSCHAIRGTDASSDVGPDLTHVASRTTLGGGDDPERRRDLRDWITDNAAHQAREPDAGHRPASSPARRRRGLPRGAEVVAIATPPTPRPPSAWTGSR